jgi:5'-phosphate synthase pdxT subunit
MKTIGVFGYQGAFQLFLDILPQMGFKVEKIQLGTDLANFDGIILPGGESSAQYKFCQENNIFTEIEKFAQSNKPILGVCAGAILLAKISSPLVTGIGLINMGIERNSYGSQIHSGTKKADDNSNVTFIRAPRFKNLAPEIQILQTYKSSPIFVKHKNIFCTSYHPELSTLDKHNPIYKIF